jgi:D123
MPGLGSPLPTTLSSNQTTSLDLASWTRRLRAHTPSVEFVTLPPGFAASLLDGTLMLPTVGVPAPEDDTWFDGTPIDPDDDCAAAPPVPPGLHETVSAINAAIRRLGGAVAPKLGRVAPSDAAWVSFHRTTRCESAAEVLTLIAASERAMRGAGSTLALRAWLDNIDPMMEYRVFVRRGAVVALSQRDPRVPSSLSEDEMDRVVDVVLAQFHADACAAFCPETDGQPEPTSYAYDVFVDRAWRPWILDAAPWGDGVVRDGVVRDGGTDALLFHWDELGDAAWMNARDARAQLRVISTHSSIRPAQAMYDSLPVELRNAGAGEALAEAAQRIIELQEERAVQRDADDCSDSCSGEN